MPKVSICIPAYQNPEGIRRLLWSIREQQHPDFELEVVITDDSENTEVEKAVSELQCEAQGGAGLFRYIRNTEHGGAAANWNRALSLADGDYLKIMHHDDWFTFPDSLARMVTLLEEHPESELCFCGTRQVPLQQLQNAAKGFKDTVENAESHDRCITPAQEQALLKDSRSLFVENSIGAPSAVLVRNPLKNGEKPLYDPALTWLVDSDYYMSILKDKTAPVYTKEPLVSIGLSDTQLTGQCIDDPQLLIREYSHLYRKHELKNAPEELGCADKMARILIENHAPEEAFREMELPVQTIRKQQKEVRRKKREQRLDTLDYLIAKVQATLWKPACAAFWLGLLIELGILLVNKSNYINPIEGQLFRVTFVLFFCKVLGTKYHRREWLTLFAFCLLGMISWKCSGRNELLRTFMFIAACKGIEPRRILQVMFRVTLAGSLLIAALSITGIYGGLTLTGDIDGTVSTRYCFGMGHPNSFHIMAAMLVLLGCYLYRTGARRLHAKYYAQQAILAGLMLLNILLFLLCRSMMGFGAMAAAILWTAWLNREDRKQSVSAAGIKPEKDDMPNVETVIGSDRPEKADEKGRRGGFVYIFWELCFAAGLLFSLDGATFGRTGLVHWIDIHLLTGRISALWDSTFHDGTLSSWTWFSRPLNDHYFDMGWVRLIYWYGVIPAVVLITMLFLLYKQIRIRRDREALMLLTILCLFTVMEAHIVSEYLARNYLLVLMAAYMPDILGIRKDRLNTGGNL